jgi:hypothetical protein
MLLKGLREVRLHGIKGPVSQAAGASHDAPSSTCVPERPGRTLICHLEDGTTLVSPGSSFDDAVKEPIVPAQSGRRRRPGNVGLERFLNVFL